jgi:hypothetical protein
VLRLHLGQHRFDLCRSLRWAKRCGVAWRRVGGSEKAEQEHNRQPSNATRADHLEPPGVAECERTASFCASRPLAFNLRADRAK